MSAALGSKQIEGENIEKYLEGAEKYKQEKKIYKLLNVGEHINWEDSNGD